MSAKGRPERELLPPGGRARSAKGAQTGAKGRPTREGSAVEHEGTPARAKPKADHGAASPPRKRRASVPRKTGALSDLRIIDAANIFAGPLAATFLADFGAEVIKVEHPRKGDSLRNLGAKKDGVPLWWKLVARNKRTITLDLSHPDGQTVFLRLAATADVVVENYRPGTMERWGLGYEALAAINPGLVMLRVSGFGQTGPYARRPGFGTIAEAMSGLSNATGFPDRPPLLPAYGMADQVSALFGAYSVMVALHERARSGRGQQIDLGLYESVFQILGPLVVDYDQLGIIQERKGNRVAYQAPRNCYRTRDDRWVALSGATQEIVGRLFTALGRPELIDDPRFRDNATRLANIEALDDIVGGWIGSLSLDEVMAATVRHELAIFPSYDIGQIVDDPQYRARENIVTVADPELGPLRMQGIVPKLSRTPGAVRWSGPTKGEHNRGVYGELGLTAAELADLAAKGVI